MTSHGRQELMRSLPYARRYARALTGSQAIGDQLVAESLKGLLTSPDVDELSNGRHALYTAVTRRFDRSGNETGESGLNAQQRQLLLLTSLEEVSLEEAAAITALPIDDAETLLTQARDRLRAAAATDVLIIEDEPIIALDIEELVIGCGHRVIGVATTESEAVSLAARERPGLILADINLGAGGDGAQAVARIMRHLEAPVIFVTAYPERLLTGEATEPAFIISKPFEPLSLAIATFQAVTGGVRLD